MAEVRSFEAWDYVVFALMLVISVAIGLFYAFWGGRQKTTKEFLMADRSLQLIPVAVSILVSFLSAIMILGATAEMNTKGTQYFLYTFGMMAAIVISAQVFVPLLYPLKLTSSYEYLELRFKSRAAKITGTIIMIVQQILYMGIASYAPSVALEAVTGFPIWATIITVGLVSTFYTTLGGMKAVVWTDVFQAAIMLAGLLAIVIQGAVQVGGFGEVWRLNDEWGRIVFFNFNPDPTQRHSFWSLIIGGMVDWVGVYGVNQASVQRFCALPSLAKAKMSVFLNVLGVFILVTIICVAGIVVFAYYAQKGCHPYTAKYISNSNQIIPYFVMEVLGYPGVPGLFVACLFSGALSSMSSCLNALAAVSWEDFLKPYLDHKLTEVQKTWVTKLLVLLYGASGIGMAFMFKNLGGTVLQASLSFTGASTGPLLGIFLLASVFPWANWIGCVVGGLLGLALPLWISIGAYSVVGPPSSLAFPSANCSHGNASAPIVSTTLATLTSTTPFPAVTGIDRLYTVSYLWYPTIGVLTSVVVGLIVSFITGPMKREEVDPKYLMPIFDRLFCCLPECARKPCRCGYEFEDPEVIWRRNHDAEIDVFLDDVKNTSGHRIQLQTESANQKLLDENGGNNDTHSQTMMSSKENNPDWEMFLVPAQNPEHAETKL